MEIHGLGKGFALVIQRVQPVLDRLVHCGTEDGIDTGIIKLVTIHVLELPC
jgi:hypothetical protein